MVLGVQGCSETRWMGRWAAQVALARAQAFFCFFLKSQSVVGLIFRFVMRGGFTFLIVSNWILHAKEEKNKTREQDRWYVVDDLMIVSEWLEI